MVSVGNNTELNRGKAEELGGCVRLAQMVLMAEHPEVRYADLMNPHKFQKEKLEAGRRVAEAMEDFRLAKQHPESPPGFHKLTDVMATAVRGMNSINVRRELLYAMGQPENLSADALRSLMATPEGNITANGLLDSLGKFSQSASQAMTSMSPQKRVQKLNEIDENSFTPYKNLRGKLSKEEMDDFIRAAGGMEMAFRAEGNWMKATLESGHDDSLAKLMGLNATMTKVREWVVNDGEVRNLTEEKIKDIQQIEPDACQYLQEHKGAFPPGRLQALRYGGAHINPGEVRATQATLQAGRDTINETLHDMMKNWGRKISEEDETMLMKECPMRSADRTGTRSSIVQGRLMARGLSLDALEAFSEEEKAQANKDFLHFVSQRKMNPPKPASPEMDEALEDYADLYTGWGRQLLKEKIPDIDFTNPSELKDNSRRMLLFGNQLADYFQSQKYLVKQPKFTETLAQDVKDNEASLVICENLAQACEKRFGEDSVSRLMGEEILRRYGPKLAGRQVSEFSALVDVDEMNTRMSVMMGFVAITLTEKQCQEYLLNGIPKDMMEDIDRQVERSCQQKKETEAKKEEGNRVKTGNESGDRKNGDAPKSGKINEAPPKEHDRGAAAEETKAPQRRLTAYTNLADKVTPKKEPRLPNGRMQRPRSYSVGSMQNDAGKQKGTPLSV